MKRNSGMLTFGCILLPLAGGFWWWYIASHPPDKGDFVSVTGTLASAKVEVIGNRPILEFHLAESPIRFRAALDEQPFDREAFSANARAGATVTLDVEKAELDAPSHPPFDPVDTVWVRGLREGKTPYSTLDEHLKWSERNRFYGLLMAICFTVACL